jgi:hypothetical protein
VTANEVDLDLHGIAGVRIIDGSQEHVAGVMRDVGLVRRPLSGPPDLVVRFVARLETAPVSHLGLEHGWTDDGVVVRAPRHWAGGASLLPLHHLARLGAGSEPFVITCERGVRSVPHLIDLLNICAVRRGWLPLHAAAVVHRGVGIVLVGWSKGGKTETLLGLLRRNATDVGDEWVYLGDDGNVLGVGHRMRMWDWHLQQAPELAARLPRAQRRRLATLRRVDGLHRRLPPTLRRTPPGKLLTAIIPTIEAERGVYVKPHELLVASHLSNSCAMDRLVHTQSSDDPSTTIEDGDPLLLADRMAASLRYERRSLADTLTKCAFAFPTAAPDPLADVTATESELLRERFAGRPTSVLTHPYPVSLDAMADAVERLL